MISAGSSRLLAPPPQPLSVGRSILATVEPHEHAMLDAIRELGIEWHAIFNKASVMALPAGITKATGLRQALKELAIPAEQVVRVGDAENDHVFLQLCGVSVAVANALPSLKAEADIITNEPRGAGVTELINRVLFDDLIKVVARPRTRSGQ